MASFTIIETKLESAVETAKDLQSKIRTTKKAIVNYQEQAAAYEEKVLAVQKKISAQESALNAKRIKLNEVNIQAQTVKNKLELAKQKLEASKKAQAGNQAVADALANNVEVSDQAGKDINKIEKSIDKIASESKDATGFNWANTLYVIAGLAAAAILTLLAIRRRRKRSGTTKDEIDDEYISFEELLAKIKADNLNQKTIKKATPIKKAAAKGGAVKKPAVKKSAVKKTAVKKSSIKKTSVKPKVK